MNGVAPEPGSAIRPAEIRSLEESFRAFSRVTRSLEQAYGRLERRARGMDTRLEESNRRLTEKVVELKRVTGELHGILDAIPCGVVAADREGTLFRVNPAAERILGRPAAELVGRDARTLLDHRGQPILLLGRGNVRPGTTVERLVSCLDGSARYLCGSVAGLQDGGRLEVISDQTEVAHLRSQVNRLDTLAALGEMAAGVAHEIRNPMSGVEGFAGLLEKALAGAAPPDRAVLARYADRIRRGVAEVNGIITNLLLWARPEKTRMEDVAVAALLDEVRADTRGAAGAADLGIGDVPDDLRVRGDRLKLKLALGNLVRNALEAAGAGGRVRAGATLERGRLVVTVDDDGPGIPPEVRARLFQPFCTTKAGGTGLGLALTRKLVELHGGEVSAGRSPLGGARFTVVLPGARTKGRTP